MDLSCQGSTYYKTPHIDKLADSGMRFTDGYAACAVCSPTRAAVMTGRWPGRLGITDWIRSRFQGGQVPADGKNPSGWTNAGDLRIPQNPLWLEHEEITLAELLKPAGYTSCYIGKWHLGTDDWYPERQGFDFNFGGCDYGQPPSYFDPFNQPKGRHQMLRDGIPSLPGRNKGEYLVDREGDEAVNFIRKHKAKPFFLQFSSYAVHTPIQSREDYRLAYAKEVQGAQFDISYAAMMQSVDENVGKVLDLLDELKLTENTLVIFTSDNGGLDRHGSPTDNAPLRSGKGFAYEGGIRVPWIIRWPGVTKAGSESAVPITSVDIFPTLADAAGLTPKHQVDGLSLRPALKGATLDRESIFWHFPHLRHRPGPYSIIRKGDLKLIKWYSGPRYDLFNLSEDIGETRNLAADQPETVKTLDAELMKHLEAIGAKIPQALKVAP